MVLAGLLGALLDAERAAVRPTTRARCSSRRATSRREPVIDGRSLRVSRVHADAGVLATLFDASAIDDAARPELPFARIPAGSLVTHDDVRAPTAGSGAARDELPDSRHSRRRRRVGGGRSRRRAGGAAQHRPQQLRRDRRAGPRVLESRRRPAPGLRRREHHARRRPRRGGPDRIGAGNRARSRSFARRAPPTSTGSE